MTNAQIERLQRFVEYAQKLKGDEKGEAQVFCDRLFQAFGHEGYKEAGATLEERQKRGKNVKFIDLFAPTPSPHFFNSPTPLPCDGQPGKCGDRQNCHRLPGANSEP